MASEECIAECLTVLRLMKGDKWETAHNGFYGAILAPWSDEQARAVVNRCANTLTFRPSRAELIAAVTANDGRPDGDEAWAMLAWDEAVTCVITEEMAEAQGIANPVYSAGDRVGARMAFRDAYNRLVAEARSLQRPVSWFVSRGTDKDHAKTVVLDAMQKGRISPAFAFRHLPPGTITSDGKMIEEADRMSIGPLPQPIPEAVRKQIAGIGKRLE